MDQKINMDVKMTNNPAAIHFSGTVEGGGQSGKLEAYQVGDENVSAIGRNLGERKRGRT